MRIDQSVYHNNGSEGKYIALTKVLIAHKNTHREFKNELKRGKRLDDMNYLKDVEENIQEYLSLLCSLKYNYHMDLLRRFLFF